MGIQYYLDEDCYVEIKEEKDVKNNIIEKILIKDNLCRGKVGKSCVYTFTGLKRGILIEILKAKNTTKNGFAHMDTICEHYSMTYPNFHSQMNKLKNMHPLFNEKITSEYGGWYSIVLKNESDYLPEKLHINIPMQTITHVERDEIYNINNLSKQSYKLDPVPIFRRPFFIKDSRKDIFEKINHAFENAYKSNSPNVVILTGPGGLGKSELAKEYAEVGIKNNTFKYVIYSRFDKNQKRDKDFKNIINNDNLIKLIGFERKIDDDDDSYYNRKLTTLLESQKKDTLYIIDNYDTPDTEVERVLNGEYGNIDLSLLIISREPMENYPFERVPVGTLKNEKHLVELFQKNVKSTYKYSKNLLSEKNIEIIKKINSLVQNHTLAIEILAKSLPTNKNLDVYYMELTAADGHIFETMKTQVRAGENYSRIPLEIIKRLFKISKLQKQFDKEKLQHILTFFYGLPLQGISTDTIYQFVEDDYYDIIEALISRGWINVDEVSNHIYLHALVRETVFDFYKDVNTSKLGIDKCSLILEKHIINNKKFVNTVYYSDFSSKTEFAKFLTSFLKAFPYNDNLNWTYSHNFYIKVVQILIYCNEWALSEDLIIDILTSKINGFNKGYLYYMLGKVIYFYRRYPEQAKHYFNEAETIMNTYARSTEERIELAIFYKDCASIFIEDLNEYIKEDTKRIEELLKKAEDNVNKIFNKDFNKVKLIKIINNWRAYLFAYKDDIKEAENILMINSLKKDELFEIEETTILLTNALIYRKKGDFSSEANLLEKSLRINEKYFARNRKGNEEKYTAIYKAYKNSENWKEALRIATEGRDIVREIYGAQVNEKGRAAEAFYSFSDRVDEARQKLK